MRRVFRSMFGWMISAAEDPELILEQNIRDLNDQVPKMNESIAMVKAKATRNDNENKK
jgi:phage shock protein A